MNETTYLGCAETAKLLRAHIKREFPGVTFSITSKTYSGGASIDIRWTDGPTEKEVSHISSNYSGGNFDGMIDMKFHNSSWLMPDGTIQFAATQGTEGSMGVHAAVAIAKPHTAAKLVHLHADFVFTNRRYSRAFLLPIAERVCQYWDQPMVEIEESSFGAWVKRSYDPPLKGHYSIDDLIMQEAQTVSGFVKPAANPIADDNEPLTHNAQYEPATSRQLWALHCITKLDTRSWDITKSAASDLISRAKNGVDIKPIVKEFVLA